MICPIPESALINKCFSNWNEVGWDWWELRFSNIDITWGWRLNFLSSRIFCYLRYGIDFLTKAKLPRSSCRALEEVCFKYSSLHWGWMSKLHCPLLHNKYIAEDQGLSHLFCVALEETHFKYFWTVDFLALLSGMILISSKICSFS